MIGSYRATADPVIVYRPNNLRLGGPSDRCAVIAIHGAGQTAFDGSLDNHAATVFPSIVAAGWTMYVPDAAGGAAWSNDAAVAAVTACADLAVADGFASRFHVVAASMGGGAAARWAAANPSRVASLTLVSPCVDLVVQHAWGEPFTASIETAWGGLSAFNAAMPTKNPSLVAPSLAAGTFPVTVMYDTDDGVVPPSAMARFAAESAAATIVKTGLAHTAYQRLTPDLVFSLLDPHDS